MNTKYKDIWKLNLISIQYWKKIIKFTTVRIHMKEKAIDFFLYNDDFT